MLQIDVLILYISNYHLCISDSSWSESRLCQEEKRPNTRSQFCCQASRQGDRPCLLLPAKKIGCQACGTPVEATEITIVSIHCLCGRTFMVVILMRALHCLCSFEPF
jgi:hypothetical protein